MREIAFKANCGEWHADCLLRITRQERAATTVALLTDIDEPEPQIRLSHFDPGVFAKGRDGRKEAAISIAGMFGGKLPRKLCAIAW